MRVLVLEDDRNYSPIVEEALEQFDRQIAVTAVVSRDACVAAARDADFDLAIIDLRVPTANGNLDSDMRHGVDAYRQLIQITPGTPIILHSGYGSEDLLEEVLQEGRQEDLFGSGPLPMIQAVRKGSIPKLLRCVERILQPLRDLEAVEVKVARPISDLERRVLRIHAQRNSGVLVTAEPIEEGLSEVQVLRVRVEDSMRQPRAFAIAKLGPLPTVSREHSNYQMSSGPLAHPTVPQLSGLVQAGAGRQGGLFYAVAENHTPLFEVLAQDPERAAAAVRALKDRLRGWWGGAPLVARTLGDIRRSLTDDRVPEDMPAEWLAKEAGPFQASSCTRHGDLHGANVLVDPNGTPVLIDFARTGPGEAAVDPVTLELSVLFHPAANAVGGEWPSLDAAATWPTLGDYLRDSPLVPFIQACREWATDVAVPREVYACAYGYTVRQLLFPDTDKNLARVIAQSCVVAFESS